MNHKEMREKLRAAGVHVPRANLEVEKAYSMLSDEDTRVEDAAEKQQIKLVSSNIYTYVGKGDTPPHRINFIGLQWFTRGEAVEVKNIEVLEKVRNNDSFRKGKVDMDEFYKFDELEAKKAELQRKQDRITDAEAKRSMSGH